MEQKDLAIQYEGLYKSIKLAIMNIESIGFDGSKYQKELQIIDEKTKGKVVSSSKELYATANVILDYDNGIKELDKLSDELKVYDCYFIAINSCKWIEIRMNNDISLEELQKLVSEMIRNINLIINSNTMNYDNEKHIVEKIYEVAYNLIKLEILKTGQSELYRFALNEPNTISYFNTLVNEDINGLKVDKKLAIKEKLYERYKEGISANIFDIELIKRILASTDNISFKKVIYDNLDSIELAIKDNNHNISSFLKTVEDSETLTKEKQDIVLESRKDVRKKVISISLLLSLFIGGGIGTKRIATNIATKNKYNRKIEYYSTIDSEISTNSSIIYTDDEMSDSVKIRTYGEYQNSSRREYTEYDIPDKDLTSLEDYLDYDLKDYRVVSSSKVQKKGDGISPYPDTYTSVTKDTYEYLGKELSPEDYKTDKIVALVIYCVIVLVSEICYLSFNDELIIIPKIKELLTELIPVYKDYKHEYLGAKKDLEDKSIELRKLINQNEELKIKFNELYEENKFLLDNPNELYDRINKLLNNEELTKAKETVRVLRMQKLNG